ncbi:hypothetical protein M2283_009433 [Streptomyces pseudovenezuelae]|uniref:Uncharacterized protein n=1 Tax=Streptomyces pseudovenezuelae TaxID=67350 RepID=A0ABT6M273_9ACTN|nr:hypothetical protein [Streptomyces pseudovenezuelae]
MTWPGCRSASQPRDQALRLRPQCLHPRRHHIHAERRGHLLAGQRPLMEPRPVRERPPGSAGSPPTAPTRPTPHTTSEPATSSSLPPAPAASFRTAPQRPARSPRPGRGPARSRPPGPVLRRPASRRWPTPSIPARPRPTLPGRGRLPPAARQHEASTQLTLFQQPNHRRHPRPPGQRQHTRPQLPRDRRPYARPAETVLKPGKTTASKRSPSPQTAAPLAGRAEQPARRRT